MKNYRIPILLASAVILGATLACATLSMSPTVSNIRMTTDVSGNTSTTSYAPGATFFVFADLKNLASGARVEAKWIAVKAVGLDQNSELNTSEYTYEAEIQYLYFQLTTTDGSPWPTGNYRVDLYLNGIKVGGQDFVVR